MNAVPGGGGGHIPPPDVRTESLAENPYAGQGPVLLDIGEEVGALVVRMPASMEGVEIEIAHTHDHAEHEGREHRPPHVAVVARPTEHGFVHSAVFPELEQGTYELNERSGPARLRVEVTGGAVTQAAWPEGVLRELHGRRRGRPRLRRGMPVLPHHDEARGHHG